MIIYSNNIRKIRESQFLTQRYVAFSIDYSLSRYGIIENSLTIDLKLSTCFALAKVFNCSFYELFIVDTESSLIPALIKSVAYRDKTINDLSFEIQQLKGKLNSQARL